MQIVILACFLNYITNQEYIFLYKIEMSWTNITFSLIDLMLAL